MPQFTTIKNPFASYVGESHWYGAGKFAIPEYPTITFKKGELTKREAKQMNVMCWLDFYGLTLIAKKMNKTKKSFTECYFIVKKQGELKKLN